MITDSHHTLNVGSASVISVSFPRCWIWIGLFVIASAAADEVSVVALKIGMVVFTPAGCKVFCGSSFGQYILLLCIMQ